MVAEKTTALVRSTTDHTASLARGLRIESMNDLSNFGAMLAKSGYFRDAKDAAQACVKVQAGLELGIPPVQAMTGIHIVEGKPTLSAGLIATLVKRSGRYNYRIVKHDDTECSIAFFENNERIGVSTFTMNDARQAGVLNSPSKMWTKYARNMLFARAMSNGARWHCPDIFGGPVYTPEEMGVPVNEDGEPVAAAAVEVRGEVVEPEAGPSLSDLQLAARAELDRLLIGDGMDDAEKKAARTGAVKRINGDALPRTSAEWARVVDALREEPTPEKIEETTGA
jgi:hypothetical protein